MIDKSKLLKMTLVVASLLAAAARCRADEPTLPGLENEQPKVSREAVLKSPEWQKTMKALHQSLSAQKLYSNEQVADYIRRVNAEVKGMSAEQMIDFMHDTQKKVTILNDSQANEQKRQFRENLSFYTPAYQAKLRAQVPDLLDMPAQQLQTYLDSRAVREEQTKQMNADLQKGRQQRAQFLQEQQQQQDADRQRSLDRAASYSDNPTYVAPIGAGFNRPGGRYVW